MLGSRGSDAQHGRDGVTMVLWKETYQYRFWCCYFSAFDLTACYNMVKKMTDLSVMFGFIWLEVCLFRIQRQCTSTNISVNMPF